MLMTIDPISNRQAMPRPVPSPIAKPSLQFVDTNSVFFDKNSVLVDTNSVLANTNSVLVVLQLELIRSSGVLVSMYALTQHLYAVPDSNPLTWTSIVVFALMLDTFTSWIRPSDSADAVHDKSYPLMILLLGIDCCSDHSIITEVESALMEMSCGD